jgi:hypothetical protein
MVPETVLSSCQPEQLPASVVWDSTGYDYARWVKHAVVPCLINTDSSTCLPAVRAHTCRSDCTTGWAARS